MKIPSAHQPGVLSPINTGFGEGGSAHPSFLSLKAWRAGGRCEPLVCTGARTSSGPIQTPGHQTHPHLCQCHNRGAHDAAPGNTKKKKKERNHGKTEPALTAVPSPSPFAQFPIFLSLFFLRFNLPTEVLGPGQVPRLFRLQTIFCSPV